MAPTPDLQRRMLRQMQTIRRFEERASADYLAGDIYGIVHCYIGEEAVAVGVCAALDKDDQIISTHRGHGHCIAKGADLNRMMAELYGRETGYCKGKGGSMHIADFDIGMLGANGIVAGGISIITGAGLAAQMAGQGPGCGLFFRRWRFQRRTVPRVGQYRGQLEAAGGLRLREQSLGRDRADEGFRLRRGRRRTGEGLRHSRCRGRRQRCAPRSTTWRRRPWRGRDPATGRH